MDLLHFVKVLLRRKFILILVPIATVLLVFGLTRSNPRQFVSYSQIATGITDYTQFSLDETKQAVQQYDVTARFANLTELMKSRAVMDLISYDALYHDLTSKSPFRSTKKLKAKYSADTLNYVSKKIKLALDSGRSVDQDAELKVLRALEEMKYDLTNLRKRLFIDRATQSDYIQVVFDSENPHLSAFIVNSACANFIRYYKDGQKVSSRNSVLFFGKLVESKKAELDSKVAELKAFKIKHDIINLSEQTKTLVEQTKDLEIQREEDAKKIPGLQKAMANIEARYTGRDKKFLEYSNSLINNKIDILKDQITAINNRYIATGMRNGAMRDSVKALRKQMDRRIVEAADNLAINPSLPRQELVLRRVNTDVDLQIAKGALGSIDKALAALRTRQSKYTPLEATISAFEREIEVASKVYLLVLDKYNAAQFNQLNQGAQLRQIEKATAPGKPEPSKNLLLIALAAVVAFTLCIVIIFIIEYLDLSVRTPNVFMRQTGLPLLGSLNQLHGRELNLSKIFGNKVTFEEEIFKQQIRGVRFLFEEKMANHTVLFTSTREGAGKSFAMETLAYTLRLAGYKVLLVDANVKNNKLTRDLNINATSRFSGTQMQLGLPEPMYISENFSAIGCSTSAFSPAELFAGHNMAAYLNSFKKDFDFIFVESAALNKYPDAKELAGYVDSVVSVYSALNTIDAADKHNISSLKALDGKFRGAILNNIRTENLDQIVGEAAEDLQPSFLGKLNPFSKKKRPALVVNE